MSVYVRVRFRKSVLGRENIPNVFTAYLTKKHSVLDHVGSPLQPDDSLCSLQADDCMTTTTAATLSESEVDEAEREKPAEEPGEEEKEVKEEATQETDIRRDSSQDQDATADELKANPSEDVNEHITTKPLAEEESDTREEALKKPRQTPAKSAKGRKEGGASSADTGEELQGDQQRRPRQKLLVKFKPEWSQSALHTGRNRLSAPDARPTVSTASSQTVGSRGTTSTPGDSDLDNTSNSDVQHPSLGHQNTSPRNAPRDTPENITVSPERRDSQHQRKTSTTHQTELSKRRNNRSSQEESFVRHQSNPDHIPPSTVPKPVTLNPHQGSRLKSKQDQHIQGTGNAPDSVTQPVPTIFLQLFAFGSSESNSTTDAPRLGHVLDEDPPDRPAGGGHRASALEDPIAPGGSSLEGPPRGPGPTADSGRTMTPAQGTTTLFPVVNADTTTTTITPHTTTSAVKLGIQGILKPTRPPSVEKPAPTNGKCRARYPLSHLRCTNGCFRRLLLTRDLFRNVHVRVSVLNSPSTFFDNLSHT